MAFKHFCITVDEREFEVGAEFEIRNREIVSTVIEEWIDPAVDREWQCGDPVPAGLLEAASEFLGDLDLSELIDLEE